jgi:hypothetical protein
MPANPYQFSLRTSRDPGEVLDDVAARPLPGIAVSERGAHYLVLRPRRRSRYGSDIAVGIAIAIVLAVLIATAMTPVLIVLLPLAVLPGIPLLLDHRRPDLAVSAVVDDDGSTRVTIHGEASEELAAAVDAFVGALPDAHPVHSDADADAVASTG